MKVSIVLSSYNGRRYIKDQLQSILNQTKQPDEVIIVDDASTDDTTEIVESFIIKNHLNSNWRLVVNTTNKGWRRNFMDAFHESSGDIIFSCDQDDIWDNEKIFQMTSCFENCLEMEVLASNFTPFRVVNGKREYMCNGLTRRKTGVSFKKRVERARLNNLVLQTFIPGCSLAFRRSFLEFVDKVWYPEWAHDSVISTVAKLRGSFFFLNEQLLLYRRHDGTSTPKNVKSCIGRIQSSEDYLKRINRLIDNANGLELSNNTINKLNEIQSFLESRIAFFSSRISIKSLLGLFRTVCFYPSLYSWGGDLYIRLRRGWE